MDEYITILDGALVFHLPQKPLAWQLPQFPLSNVPVQSWQLQSRERRPIAFGLEETLEFACAGTNLCIMARIYPSTGIVRFRYSLDGSTFDGLDGRERIFYGSLACTCEAWTEIQLSQFDRITHSFVPSVQRYKSGSAPCTVIGPAVLGETAGGCVLLAYEHGSQAPDHFLEIRAGKDGASLLSSKGNYYNGQQTREYLAPWIQIGAAGSEEEMLRAYRTFMLYEIAPDSFSRKPYIFYNTWHFQEGRKYLLGRSVLHDMREDFILADIDRAHELGVEVYVIDTGWFQKTGEWQVNGCFFPSGMQKIKDRLSAYGMKLGLWFNPIVAAKTSAIFMEHPEYVIRSGDTMQDCGRIWETEESYGMCLDTPYAHWFAMQLIRLYKELGVRYFKWDAVSQYGCDSPMHRHGGPENTVRERKDAYAYRMGLCMIRIVEELTSSCPEAIVDFDVTEGGRFFGLGFLSVGKYFLMNNGPYFHNFDIPAWVRMEPDTINAFFYPGPARAQICRQNTRFDFLIPSVLFLTHFLPHGGALSGSNNMAAMALGGNGIWGYLEQMDTEEIARWRDYIACYKLVRDDITAAYPRISGTWGGSPEIYEKINEQSGLGCVVFFTHGGGTFTYRTRPLHRQPNAITGCDTSSREKDGSYIVSVTLESDGAKTVFFLP